MSHMVENVQITSETVGRNVDIKSTFDEGLKVSVGDSKESFYHSRELLHHCEQNVDRNVNVKVASGENSNEELVTGH